MKIKQEPKYIAMGERIYNRVSGREIPDDEPVFILRARDHHAAQIIHAYAGLCSNSQHIDAVLARVRDFERFAKDNPDRMKEPDTSQWPPITEVLTDE